MKIRTIEKTLVTGLGITCPAVPLYLYFAGNWYAVLHSYSIGMALGITAYSYFLLTLIVSARIRYLDRLFGHDSVLVFHRSLAITAVLLALGHAVFKKIYAFVPTFQTLLGIAALSVFGNVALITALLMVRGVQHRLGFIAKLKSTIVRRGRLDYSQLKLFHNITSLAAVAVAVHVGLASATRENRARMGFMGIWAAAALALYVYHKFIRVLVNKRNALTLSNAAALAPGIITLEMKRTGAELPAHAAGQFGYFRILSKVSGHEEHPFTISSAPLSPALSITVKNLGDYTARLKDLRPGTRVLFDGPYGIFTPRQDGRMHVFIAGGIGITPFLSVLEEWGRDGIKQRCLLVWSVRQEAEMVRRGFFEDLQKKSPAFRFVPVITSHRDETGGRRRIDRELLESAIGGPVPANAVAWVCGPEPLRENVVEYLREMGMHAGKIRYEKFAL
jgi:predicted ferric reductase